MAQTNDSGGPVWITGASSGIGRALALELARAGRTVVASARRTDELDRMVLDAAGLAGRIVPLALDVTDRSVLAPALARIGREIGPIDLVVLAAGTHSPVEARSFEAEVFRKLVEINLMGVVHCLEAALPAMIARRGGHIAIVSSVAGYSGLPTAAGYGATKAALINMAEALKFDLDPLNIRLQLIDPGFVRTPLTDKNPFPMPFLIEPEEAARRIVKGLATSTFEITFPRRFTWMLKFLRIMPYALYFPLVRRMTGK